VNKCEGVEIQVSPDWEQIAERWKEG